MLRLYLLVVGALRALADGQRHAPLVLDAFLLRAMGTAGWAPALTECARCGAPGPHRAFSVPAGGVVCPGCRPAGAATPSAQTVQLLDALASGTGQIAEDAAPRGRAARPAAWSPPTCSGTSNANCAPSPWSNAALAIQRA